MTATSAPARGGVRSPAGGAVRGARRRWRLPFSPWHLVLIPATIVLIFPFVWLVITSVETPPRRCTSRRCSSRTRSGWPTTRTR